MEIFFWNWKNDFQLYFRNWPPKRESETARSNNYYDADDMSFVVLMYETLREKLSPSLTLSNYAFDTYFVSFGRFFIYLFWGKGWWVLQFKSRIHLACGLASPLSQRPLAAFPPNPAGQLLSCPPVLSHPSQHLFFQRQHIDSFQGGLAWYTLHVASSVVFLKYAGNNAPVKEKICWPHSNLKCVAGSAGELWELASPKAVPAVVQSKVVSFPGKSQFLSPSCCLL